MDKPSDIFSQIEEADQEDRANQELDLGPLGPLAEKQNLLEKKADPKNIARLYKVTQDHKLSIADLEGVIKLLKKDLYDVKQVQIPEFMKTVNMKAVKTDQNISVEIKNGYSTTIRDQEGFYGFVREQESGDIIKDSITITLEESEREKVDEIFETLDRLDLFFERKEAIHAQSLKKFVRICMEKGIKIPEDVANVYEYQYSEVKGL